MQSEGGATDRLEPPWRQVGPERPPVHCRQGVCRVGCCVTVRTCLHLPPRPAAGTCSTARARLHSFNGAAAPSRSSSADGLVRSKLDLGQPLRLVLFGAAPHVHPTTNHLRTERINVVRIRMQFKLESLKKFNGHRGGKVCMRMCEVPVHWKWSACDILAVALNPRGTRSAQETAPPAWHPYSWKQTSGYAVTYSHGQTVGP